MRKDDSFLSERLFFRGINEQDTDCLVRWRSDPRIIRYCNNPVPLVEQSHLYWYQEKYLKSSNRFDFIVIDRILNKKIGFMGIKDIDWESRQGEISYAIAEKNFLQKGYAKEAIWALLKYIQRDIKLAYAIIHQDNIASIKTVSSLGFILGGCVKAPFFRYEKMISQEMLYPLSST